MKQEPFFLLVKPNSYQCNLRCDYCFYLCKESIYQDKSQLKMKEEVLEKTIRSYLGTRQEQYNICWQGGEPMMMGLSFYKKVVELQMQYGHRGARIANAIQTNGTLIDEEWAVFFKKYHFLVGVSLDGTEEMHDVFRRDSNESGSHKKVLRGIEFLKKHGVSYNLLALVNQSNVHKPKELYEYLKTIGCNHIQFTPCVEFSEDGTLLPYAITGEEWGSFLCEIFDLWLQDGIGKIAIRHFDAILKGILYGRCSLCTMGRECSEYFVVEHNGDIYPCDFFVEQERKLGNIMENTWKELLSRSEYQKFKAGKLAWNITCNMCPYNKYCNGDCQKNRFRLSENSHNSSWLCNGWKMFFQQALPVLEQIANRYQ